MELEDAILSTLKEIEDKGKSKLLQPKKVKDSFEIKEKIQVVQQDNPIKNVVAPSSSPANNIGDEEIFLKSTREKLLVLFEGFQAPNNTNIEAKIDLTLNYLEYLLASIDSRLEKLKGDSNGSI